MGGMCVFEPIARVTRHDVGRRTVLTVSGEIDLDSVTELADVVETALADGAAELWIDLSATDFLDSAGLHLLLDTRRRAAELGRRLAVVCPAGTVRRVFEVAGVAEALPLYDDRTAAQHAA
jgi:anti-sigma B factor antagonist